MKMIRSAAVGRAKCWPASVLGWAAFVALQPLACVTKDVDPPGEETGNGGSGVAAANGGSSGSSGSPGNNAGGSSGSSTSTGGIASDPLFGIATPCLPIGQALLSDFTPAGAGATDAGADGGAADAGPVPVPDPTAVTFGDFYSTLSGGTFRYPGGATDAYPVASDVTMGSWHLSGSIGTYSGFGIYLTGCNQLDASQYEGISFSIVGNVAMGNALSLNVGTAADDISYLWLNAQTPPPNPLAAANPGRCLPAMNQYDGTCATPSFQVPVTATPTTIEVRWEDLAGGRPSASVNPAEITDIRWIFPVPTGAGTTTPIPYDADIYIDDLRFIGGP